jgi:hypothetical protein
MNEAEFQELLKYQNLLARQVVQEAQTDRKIRFLQLATRMSVNGKKKVQTASLVHAAEEQGFSESESYRMLDDLERDGMLVQAGPGYIKRA